MSLRRQLGDDYNRCLDDSHSTYPSAYDREMDPDPQIVELETEVERLKAERNHYGGHRRDCFGADDEGCQCGWQQTQTKVNTLWNLSGDVTIDIRRAIDSWNKFDYENSTAADHDKEDR